MYEIWRNWVITNGVVVKTVCSRFDKRREWYEEHSSSNEALVGSETSVVENTRATERRG